MKYRLLITAMAMLVVQPSAAHAGIYADDLTKCLVKNASEKDKVTFVRWFFAALSANPEVKDMVSLSPAQREQNNRNVAALFQRLVLSDCRSESANAIKYEGEASLQGSFGVLGEVASRDLMSHPDVMREMEQMATFVDEEKFRALMTEAGVPAQKAPAQPK
jgi:hypothetical protein